MARKSLDTSPFEQRLRAELEGSTSELQGLEEQIRAFGEDAEGAEPADNHPGDGSDLLYEQERLMTIREGIAQRKAEIEHALEKIGRSEYGVCERCESDIAVERLEVLPFARYCIGCQELVDEAEAR